MFYIICIFTKNNQKDKNKIKDNLSLSGLFFRWFYLNSFNTSQNMESGQDQRWAIWIIYNECVWLEMDTTFTDSAIEKCAWRPTNLQLLLKIVIFLCTNI